MHEVQQSYRTVIVTTDTTYRTSRWTVEGGKEAISQIAGQWCAELGKDAVSIRTAAGDWVIIPVRDIVQVALCGSPSYHEDSDNA